MTRPPDRDAALDGILRRLDGAAEPSSSASCLDAESAAAMADGGLLPHEQAAAMEHVSTCGRCQALLAAMVRTIPEPAPQRAWWQLPSVRWLVPVAATGLAVAVWVAVEVRQPRVQHVSLSAAPEVAQGPAAGGVGQRAASPLADAAAPPRDLAPPVTAQRIPRGLAPLTPPPPAPNRQQPGTTTESVQAEVPAPAPAPIPPAAPPPPPSPALTREAADATTTAKAFRVGDRADRAAGSVAGVIAESVMVFSDVPSSDPRFRWRFGGATVQHSIDGGATWTTQVTGSTVPLAAGSSPQPDVCWIVGSEGTVLLTTDGLSWQRLPFPVRTALLTVNATSADAATVTTSDGRAFVTTDRGVNWVGR